MERREWVRQQPTNRRAQVAVRFSRRVTNSRPVELCAPATAEIRRRVASSPVAVLQRYSAGQRRATPDTRANRPVRSDGWMSVHRLSVVGLTCKKSRRLSAATSSTRQPSPKQEECTLTVVCLNGRCNSKMKIVSAKGSGCVEHRLSRTSWGAYGDVNKKSKTAVTRRRTLPMS